jgi:hypothetical protein
MADLESYVNNRVINGHCDCMFLYNTFAWPWTRIAGLIAPRPMLFNNSDSDRIFPMDANDRVIARLERLYSHFSAGDRVDAVVSVGGHAYRKDIRQAAFRFLNTFLKGDPRPVEDSEISTQGDAAPAEYSKFPIAPERLRVFATDSEFPADRRNASIDREFVPMARVDLPAEGQFPAWKERLMGELRRVTFRPFPGRVPPARAVGDGPAGTVRLETEDGIVILLRGDPRPTAGAKRVLLLVDTDQDAGPAEANRSRPTPGFALRDGDVSFELEPRGVGATRWTRKHPPN